MIKEHTRLYWHSQKYSIASLTRVQTTSDLFPRSLLPSCFFLPRPRLGPPSIRTFPPSAKRTCVAWTEDLEINSSEVDDSAFLPYLFLSSHICFLPKTHHLVRDPRLQLAPDWAGMNFHEISLCPSLDWLLGGRSISAEFAPPVGFSSPKSASGWHVQWGE